ncbi:hypothetical protein BH20CHL1_BH20CHL1_04440 [soil metagenome]
MDVDGPGEDFSQPDQTVDRVKRRAFKPPRQRRRVRRYPTGSSFSVWSMRDGLGYGFTRAICAIGFGLTPSLGGRFGDASLAIISTALALLMFAIVAGLVRMGRPAEWRLVADGITLLVLVPVLATASGIEVADARLGGRSANFLAAAAAALLIYAVVVVVATRAGADRNAATQIGVLPGGLSITAILLGASHFSAGALWRGLTVSWMVAAIVTALAMFVSLRARGAVAPVTFAVFSLTIVFLESTKTSERSLSSESSAIAMGAAAVVAMILVLIPLPQRRVRAKRPQRPDNQPFSR